MQYYCRTKDDMLLLVMNHVNDRLVRRIDALEPARNAVDRLCDVLHQWLPLDAERITDARVWLAFAARAVVNPRLGEVEAANTRQPGSAAGHAVDTVLRHRGVHLPGSPRNKPTGQTTPLPRART